MALTSKELDVILKASEVIGELQSYFDEDFKFRTKGMHEDLLGIYMRGIESFKFVMYDPK